MITTKQMMAASRMWQLGSPSTSIAYELGINRDSLWTYIRNHRDQFPKRNHGLDWWRERLAPCEGMTGVKAAMALGCSEKTVSYWRREIRRADERRAD